VGYRIKPDYYSFNVVLVKRHGPGYAQAGQEYETTLAYCKNLSSAVQWMHNHIARARGQVLEGQLPDNADSIQRTQALLRAFEESREHTLRAIADLQARLEATGVIKPSDMAKVLRTDTAEEQNEPA